MSNSSLSAARANKKHTNPQLMVDSTGNAKQLLFSKKKPKKRLGSFHFSCLLCPLPREQERESHRVSDCRAAATVTDSQTTTTTLHTPPPLLEGGGEKTPRSQKKKLQLEAEPHPALERCQLIIHSSSDPGAWMSESCGPAPVRS